MKPTGTENYGRIGLGQVWNAGTRAEAASQNGDNKCSKCGSAMYPGIAIECKLTSYPDFAGDKYPCTVSRDPRQPMLVDCLKCENCGWSVSG